MTFEDEAVRKVGTRPRPEELKNGSSAAAQCSGSMSGAAQHGHT